MTTRILKPLAFIGALAVLAIVALMPAFAVPVYGLTSKTVLGVTFHKMGFLGLAAAATTAPTLTTKNREATELRRQAQVLIDEIKDTSKPMTPDEFKTKSEGAKTLLARANAIAEFTADAEIERQGGAGGAERIDSPEGDGKTKTHKRSGMAKRIEEFATRVQDAFGDVRSFVSIAVAGRGQPQNDTQRSLIEEARTLTRAIVGTTGDISGGEFLLPLTQVQSIFSLANVQQGLLQRARAYNVPGRTLRIPYLIQTDENASTTLDRPMAGNIANISIVGEGSTKPARAPEFGQRLLTVYKYAAITQVSDELLGDDFTGELPQEFINAVGQQALNKVNEDITIDGTGTAMPLGGLQPGNHAISQSRNTPSDIKPVDIFAMYAKHTHGPNSVWLASRRTVQSLYNMSLTSASLVTFLKDLTGKPEMMLLGYPIILTDLLPTLGSTADIALVNPDFYAFALRQALTVESSRDFAFTQDLTTYRFIVRAGGIPINTGSYAYKYAGSNGVDEHSPFVYLHS